jgi:hypothetical protein
LVEVLGASQGYKWDELAGYAMSGALLIFRGRKLSHFKLNFTLYSTQHWLEWDQFSPLLIKPPLGQIIRGLDVVHPILNLIGIQHLVIEDVAAPEQTQDGVWTIVVSCIEWRTPRPAKAKVDGAEATEDDPWDVGILKDLANQLQSLAGDSNQSNP